MSGIQSLETSASRYSHLLLSYLRRFIIYYNGLCGQPAYCSEMDASVSLPDKCWRLEWWNLRLNYWNIKLQATFSIPFPSSYFCTAVLKYTHSLDPTRSHLLQASTHQFAFNGRVLSMDSSLYIACGCGWWWRRMLWAIILAVRWWRRACAVVEYLESVGNRNRRRVDGQKGNDEEEESLG